MKHILIIKPDHIGDYILFRNFIREIKSLEKFQSCKITCVLNKSIQDLAPFLDSDKIDHFIFIDLQEYIKEKWYFHRKNQEIQSPKYDLIINALYHKFEPFEELIQSTPSSYKFALFEDLKPKHKEYKRKHKKHYTQLINISKNKPFIYEGTKKLFHKIFHQKISIHQPKIDLPKNSKYTFKIDQQYMVVFLGSADSYRKWNIYYYIDIIHHILQATNLDVILTGSSQEQLDASTIEETINNTRLHNLTNQTSLVDMLYIIKSSQFVLSNETGVAHMSMALNKYTIVISNGNHFGKFTPYPKDYSKKYFALYPFTLSQNFTELKELYYVGSDLDINDITPDKVIPQLNKIFQKLKIKKQENTNTIHFQKNCLLSPSQLEQNYQFAGSFSKLHNEIIKLKSRNEKYLIYGKGSLSKLIHSLLKNQIIGYLDKTEPASFEKIHQPNYDKIIISVLGRENIIENDLVHNYAITPNKIIKFKITNQIYSSIKA